MSVSRRRLLPLLLLPLLLLLAFLPTGRAPAATPCADLARGTVADTAIISAAPVAAGSRFADPERGPVALDRAVCRIVARVSTRPGERVGIELWMPLSGWNGRLEGLGSGGFGGVIFYAALAEAVARGFAAVTTDTGHVGGTRGRIGAVLGWARDPVQLRDWGHASVHVMTLAARRLVAGFYGRPAVRAYFVGCSTGGAEAMEEAEFFADDYDGIVAASPGQDYAHLMESFLWAAMLPARDPAALLPAGKLALLNHAVLRACGGPVAEASGVLLDPPSCRFAPQRLLCRGADDATCLTRLQAEEAQRLYSPVRDPVSRIVLYPGFARGSESEWRLIQGALIPDYAQPLLANAVFGDPRWDWRGFDFHRDARRVDQGLARLIDADDPDLSRFAAHGGRLIMTQGWSDALNAQTLPIAYYDSVVLRERSATATEAFFRLFMIPGMSHCGHGPGPRTIGGDQRAATPDPRHDVLAALIAWVEQGQAPQRLVAERRDGGRTTLALPVCPYPQATVYRDGDPARATSYRCLDRPRRLAADLADAAARLRRVRAAEAQQQ